MNKNPFIGLLTIVASMFRSLKREDRYSPNNYRHHSSGGGNKVLGDRGAKARRRAHKEERQRRKNNRACDSGWKK